MTFCRSSGCCILVVGDGCYCKSCAASELDLQEQADLVQKPSHYQIFPSLEAIEVIASSCTKEQFYGYCMGNMLKYRLRAGGKDDVDQELAKSDKYIELYENFKALCK